MPNWCANTLVLKHTDPDMVSRARKAFAEGKFLEEFVPTPGGEWDYNFSVSNWGTKWDVGSADGIEDIDGGLMLTFDSAWAPPVTAYEALETLGFTVEAMYFEPGMAFAGIYRDGFDDYYEYGSMDRDEVAATLPEELDEAFGISDSMAEWESEQDDEDDEEEAEDEDPDQDQESGQA